MTTLGSLMGPLTTVFDEFVKGTAPAPAFAYALNPGDPGLLRSLDRLTAAQASTVPAGGGSSIAAHVDHLRYGLSLLNLWNEGGDPFTGANYSASWERITVSDEEWRDRRAALGREADAWRRNLQQPRHVADADLTAIIASVAHFAYHVGAIRQIDRATRGPSARD